MDAKTRRKLDMGERALGFSRAHPDGANPGYVTAVARLEACLAEAAELALAQRGGLVGRSVAVERRRELRRTMRRVHLAHLARVARLAAREEPALAGRFVLGRSTRTYMAFRTAAGSMAAAAQERRELLVRHGLADAVLDGLLQALEDFDAADALVGKRRGEHVGASAALAAVASEVVLLVRAMDGFNRLRFAHDASLLAEWEHASHVRAAPRAAPSEEARETAARPAA